MKRFLSVFLIITLIFPGALFTEASSSTNQLSNEVVIYIPGFLGSEIYQVTPPGNYNPFPKPERIWPSIGSAKKRRLVQDKNGIPENDTFVGRYSGPF